MFKPCLHCDYMLHDYSVCYCENCKALIELYIRNALIKCADKESLHETRKILYLQA